MLALPYEDSSCAVENEIDKNFSRRCCPIPGPQNPNALEDLEFFWMLEFGVWSFLTILAVLAVTAATLPAHAQPSPRLEERELGRMPDAES